MSARQGLQRTARAATRHGATDPLVHPQVDQTLTIDKLLYLLENKRMRLFLKGGPPYAPIFEYVPIFKQGLVLVMFSDISP